MVYLTWITGEADFSGRSVFVNDIKVVVFEDAHCGCVFEPARVGKEHVFIGPSYLAQEH